MNCVMHTITRLTGSLLTIFMQWFLAKYGHQISAVALVALFVHLIATPSKSSAAKGSKKRP